ncbi:MAG: hypothetical protein U0452_06255 [Anaerolineae bacterium]
MPNQATHQTPDHNPAVHASPTLPIEAQSPAFGPAPAGDLNVLKSAAPPESVIRLSRVIGNRAVQNLVQREGEVVDLGEIEVVGSTGPLLTPAQERQAINFYASDRRYTPEIVRQIQAAIGQPETGRMEADDVQAVARWQAEHFSGDQILRPDGMTGPRTLSALFPFGLMTTESMESFSSEIEEVFSNWSTFTSPAARATAIVNAVNQRLTAAGVPATTPVSGVLSGSTLGEFDGAGWTITMNQNLLTATLSDDLKRQLVNTVYHEARHAEQNFRELRQQAGMGKTTAQLVRITGVPATIAAAAVADPMEGGSVESIVAQDEYESFYGNRASQTAAVYRELTAASTALRTARDAHNANPTPATQAALDRATARRRTAYEAYRNLPEEHDAFWTGNAMEEMYTADRAAEAETAEAEAGEE